MEELDNNDLRSNCRSSDERVRRIAPSKANRIPKPKKRGSRIGSFIDPFRWVTIWIESGLEEDMAYILVASPDVAEVREQQRIRYIDANGARRKYTSDFRVLWLSGTSSTIETKYAEDVERKGIDDLIAAIGRTAFEGQTDDYRVATELSLDAVSIENARDIVACALDDDLEALAAVRLALARMSAPVALGEVGDASGLGYRGYRAAVALLQSGALSLEPGTRVSPEATAAIGRTLAS